MMTHKHSFTNRQSTKVDEMKLLVKEHLKKYKNKRFRSAFTTTQIIILEQEYKKNAYLNNSRREDISKKLNLTERTIKIWFQNRRMKEKRENTKQTDDADSGGSETLREAIIVNSIKIEQLQKSCAVEDSLNKRSIIVETKRQIPNNIKQINKICNVEKELKLDTNTHKSVEVIAVKKEFNNSAALKNKEELKNHKKSENCNKQNTESVLRNVKSYAVNDINKFVTKEFNARQSLPKEIIQVETYDEQLANDAPVDLSKYYSVMAKQNVPWDPYNLVPVIAPGHPINRPYMLPNASYASHSSLFQQNTTSNIRKCNCNCHIDDITNQPLMNFQPHLPFLYTNYLPHILGISQQNNPINK